MNASGLLRYRPRSVCSIVAPSGFRLRAMRKRFSPGLMGPYSFDVVFGSAAGLAARAVDGAAEGAPWIGVDRTEGAGDGEGDSAISGVAAAATSGAGVASVGTLG